MTRADYDRIPVSTLNGLIKYHTKRTPVGHFLTAVLSNDLFEAVARADRENLDALPAIVSLIYNEFPAISHGSPENVRRWLQGDEFKGSEHEGRVIAVHVDTASYRVTSNLIPKI